MVIIPTVATCVYLTNVVVSVTKPWGQRTSTRRSRGKLEAVSEG
jgi:hypothetical protein